MPMAECSCESLKDLRDSKFSHLTELEVLHKQNFLVLVKTKAELLRDEDM
jgi:hypothetical protein